MALPIEDLNERLAALTTAVSNLSTDNQRLRDENHAQQKMIATLEANIDNLKLHAERQTPAPAPAVIDAVGKVQAILDTISSPSAEGSDE